MKPLYLRPALRNNELRNQPAETIIPEARDHYATMRLDTTPKLAATTRMCDALVRAAGCVLRDTGGGDDLYGIRVGGHRK